MFTEERREKIFEKAERDGRVLAKDLAEEFAVSIDSIRRDLTFMERDGLLKRTHGGAILHPKVQKKPRESADRYGEGTPFQHGIAREAAACIQENETVFIGGAGIHAVMLTYLPSKMSFTVVTNSVEIAYRLRDYDLIQTYLIGGRMKKSGNMTDGLANEFAGQFTFDRAFLTAGGLTLRGLCTATPEVAVFHRTIAQHSKIVIALIEHTKIGSDLFADMMPLSKLDLIITDEKAEAEEISMLRLEGVETITAIVHE
ncbi:DeoR/GlpR family DNA-binding transcription regulator [Bacillus sp. KH172YL63]|uniref:DeoR/GlpR family DNA-binding transcription regulator n=1 Tax=Bacillus sp. KH172YL63 TaxID=2709784 RepID=UPI0013E4F341|nr:DeoR/GlpR family DNA-binding transcription regulator [Bacillus sp. KH172YL63]BCB03750.1 DeoR family transcriptional regulator [Bacillus sp. KH172YL63]